MATNPPKGDGHRNGALKDRTHTYKRDTDTRKFMDVKKDGTPFNILAREKAMTVINKLKENDMKNNQNLIILY